MKPFSNITCVFAFTVSLIALTNLASTGVVVQSVEVVPRDCSPVKWVVISSHEIQIYNETIHGSPKSLRLFDKLPNDCPGNIIAMKRSELEASPRKDIQLRDTRTGLSTFVYKRGFWSVAKSIFKYIPYASAVIGAFDAIDCIVEWNSNSWAGKTACVLGAVTTVLGVGDAFMAAKAAAGLKDELETIADTIWDITQQVTTIHSRSTKRSVNQTLINHLNSIVIPGQKHMHDHSNVTFLHLLIANETHPIDVWHHLPQFNTSAPVRSWSSIENNGTSQRIHTMTPLNWFATNTSTTSAADARKLRSRQSCPSGGESETDQTLQICLYPTLDGVPGGAPTEFYYGFDDYGTPAQIEEFTSDFGGRFSASNGQMEAYVGLAEDIVKDTAWDTCVCYMTQNNWIVTGSVQASWNGVYNGYSPCWNPNCDNAANLG
ncbi:hypothetical protein BKA61DRAFT_677156 [Leptodontidium sp. MPI-SDFR-AT-0119]|nr:hypothetical protein BKA61DRAFT_677156 [Leptodontidium sp. MPI-SDFR-AT-0119]